MHKGQSKAEQEIWMFKAKQVQCIAKRGRETEEKEVVKGEIYQDNRQSGCLKVTTYIQENMKKRQKTMRDRETKGSKENIRDIKRQKDRHTRNNGA